MRHSKKISNKKQTNDRHFKYAVAAMRLLNNHRLPLKPSTQYNKFNNRNLVVNSLSLIIMTFLSYLYIRSFFLWRYYSSFVFLLETRMLVIEFLIFRLTSSQASSSMVFLAVSCFPFNQFALSCLLSIGFSLK